MLWKFPILEAMMTIDKEDQDNDEVTFKLRWLLDFVAQPHPL